MVPECVDIAQRYSRKRNTSHVTYIHGDCRVIPEVHGGSVADLVDEQKHGGCDADYPNSPRIFMTCSTTQMPYESFCSISQEEIFCITGQKGSNENCHMTKTTAIVMSYILLFNYIRTYLLNFLADPSKMYLSPWKLVSFVNSDTLVVPTILKSNKTLGIKSAKAIFQVIPTMVYCYYDSCRVLRIYL